MRSVKSGKFLAILFMAASLLAGCVSTPPHGLSASQVADLKIIDVVVGYTPDAILDWKKFDPSDAVSTAGTPEAKAAFAQIVKARVQQRLPDVVTGTRAARLFVTIKSVYLPVGTERFATGVTGKMTASARIVDAATGLQIIALPDTAVEAVSAGLIAHQLAALLEARDAAAQSIAIYWGIEFSRWYRPPFAS